LVSDNSSSLLKKRPKVLNVGLEIFYEALRLQKVECVHVSLVAPPKLEKRLSDALDRLL
jgi:hypothetical protein